MTALSSRYAVPLSGYLELAARASLLRSAWYSVRFRGRVVIGRRTRVRVHRSASVRLAPKSLLVMGLAHDGTAGAVLRMRPRSTLAISGRVQVMRGASLSIGYDAGLSIGAGTFVNDGAMIVCDDSITIGRDCAISWGARVMDTDVHQLLRSGVPAARRAAVVIGDRCWIGAGATVLKGVQLGADCVVGAGSVVTRSAGPSQVVAGSPATLRADDVSWRL